MDLVHPGLQAQYDGKNFALAIFSKYLLSLKLCRTALVEVLWVSALVHGLQAEAAPAATSTLPNSSESLNLNLNPAQ